MKRERERRRKHARALVLEKQTAVAIFVQPLPSRKTEARLKKPQAARGDPTGSDTARSPDSGEHAQSSQLDANYLSTQRRLPFDDVVNTA